MSNSTRKKRIFMGTIDVCGYYTALKKGFDELGIASDFFDLGDNPFSYGSSTENNNLVRMIKGAIKKRNLSSPHNVIIKTGWFLIEGTLRTALLLWSLFKYDVFIFGLASSLLRLFDLPLLKLSNKRIIFVFHGSDSRPFYVSGLTFSRCSGIPPEECVQQTHRQKKMLKWIERYADVIVSHPPSSHLHERKFIPYLRVGIPCVFRKKEILATPPAAGRPLRIVHAPTRPDCKGTDQIRAIVKKIREENSQLELIELVGRPNEEVLGELSRCDFVIDELYSDTAMASLATEAAFFAKPSVVSGYATFSNMGNLPEGSMPPSEYSHPDDVEKSIKKLIADETYRVELGKQAKLFLENNWTAKKVAERFVLLINGNFPEDWLYNPNDIRYLHGWGLPEKRVKELLRTVIKEGNKDALQLSDKPELEKLFIQFSGLE